MKQKERIKREGTGDIHCLLTCEGGAIIQRWSPRFAFLEHPYLGLGQETLDWIIILCPAMG